MNNNEAVVNRAARMAGEALYGDDLQCGSTKVTFRTVSERVRDLLEKGCDPDCCLDIDTMEYAFDLDGGGFDCADETLLQPRLVHGNHILLYHPEYGTDFLAIDCTQDELQKIVDNY